MYRLKYYTTLLFLTCWSAAFATDITGKVPGYTGNTLLFETGEHALYFNYEHRDSVKISSDGTFSYSIAISAPCNMRIYIPDGNAYQYIKIFPDEKLELNITARTGKGVTAVTSSPAGNCGVNIPKAFDAFLTKAAQITSARKKPAAQEIIDAIQKIRPKYETQLKQELGSSQDAGTCFTYYSANMNYVAYYQAIIHTIRVQSGDYSFLENIRQDDYAALNSFYYNSCILFLARHLRTKNNISITQPRVFADSLKQWLTGKTYEAFIANELYEALALGNPTFSADTPGEFMEQIKEPGIRNDLLKYGKLFDEVNSKKAPLEMVIDSSGSHKNISEVLALFQGKVVYVDFWGSWCAPCRAEIDDALQLQQKMKNEKVVFLYLANDKSRPWQFLVKKKNFTGHHILMGKDLLMQLVNDYQLNAYPTHWLVDKDGKIVNKSFSGPANPDTEKAIRELL